MLRGAGEGSVKMVRHQGVGVGCDVDKFVQCALG